MIAAFAIIAATAAQRMLEAIYGSRNARALVRRGGLEAGRGHYPMILILHLAWLSAMALGVTADTRIHPVPLALFVGLQGLRIWVMATLGPFWTTRIITLPGAPLVTRGPYRFFRHPNYLVVAGEIALLPLAFGQVAIALIFSVLNLCVIGWRIHVENAALAARRNLPAL